MDKFIRPLHQRALKNFDSLLEEMFGCFYQIEDGTEDEFVIEQCEHLQTMIEKLREVVALDSTLLVLDTLTEVAKDEGAE